MDFTPTTRTQQAISNAVRAATVDGHPQVSPAHLMTALLDQPDGLTEPLLRAVGADPAAVRADTEKVLTSLPSASGSSVSAPQFDRETARVLAHAQQLAADMGDEYVSTEHLLVGIAAAGGATGDVLRRHGATSEALQEAFTKVRGSARITSPDPEGTFQALEKYGQDLTERARAGAPRTTPC
jgi:ATP-dependent Clp protease ATP-binding subunit ClpB